MHDWISGYLPESDLEEKGVLTTPEWGMGQMVKARGHQCSVKLFLSRESDRLRQTGPATEIITLPRYVYVLIHLAPR